MPTMRVLRLITAALAAAAAVFAVVVLVMSAKWRTPDDDLAMLGMILAGALGLAGLVAVLVWRNRTTSSPQPPAQVLSGYLISAALAEIGMLLGFVFALLSESRNPFWLGLALYMASLVVLVTALREIETTQALR